MAVFKSVPPKTSSPVAVDLEIFNLNMRQPHRPSGTFASAAFCLGKDTYVVTSEAELKKAWANLEKAPLIFHNAFFDLSHLRRWVDVEPRPMWDTMLIERIMWGGYYDMFALDDLSRRYLSEYMDKSTRKEYASAETVSDAMVKYNAKDAQNTYNIAVHQRDIMNDRPEVWKVWELYDMPAVFAVMDFKGIKLDTEAWLQIAESYEKKAEEIQAECGFNPASPKQVMEALNKARIRVKDTREGTLKEYADHDLVKLILAYREAAKRAGTYGRNIVDQFVEKDGCIYPGWKIIGAETGRMACSDPNIQNIPKDEIFRRCFIAIKGNKLVIADYGQQELRILAEISRDPNMIKAFADGLDIHQATADAMKVSRKIAKNINFGMSYGLTSIGLSANLGIPEHEAEEHIRKYFASFPLVRSYIQEYRGIARHKGYVETLGGRRIWTNRYNRQSENNAINAPVQGSAAEMTKRAVGLIHKHYGSKMPIVGVIHDEVVADVSEKKADATAKIISKYMTTAFREMCPNVSDLKCVDIHIGQTWADKG